MPIDNGDYKLVSPAYSIAFFLLFALATLMPVHVNADQKQTFEYFSIKEPHFKSFYRKYTDKRYDSWGDKGVSGSDAYSNILDCASDDVEFCIDTVLFTFGFACEALQVDKRWSINDWMFDVFHFDELRNEYHLMAEGEVMFEQNTQIRWHFIYSKSHGVRQMIMMKDVETIEEVKLLQAWHVEGRGLGAGVC